MDTFHYLCQLCLAVQLLLFAIVADGGFDFPQRDAGVVIPLYVYLAVLLFVVQKRLRNKEFFNAKYTKRARRAAHAIRPYFYFVAALIVVIYWNINWNEFRWWGAAVLVLIPETLEALTIVEQNFFKIANRPVGANAKRAKVVYGALSTQSYHLH